MFALGSSKPVLPTPGPMCTAYLHGFPPDDRRRD
jgi:hypothetical protein